MLSQANVYHKVNRKDYNVVNGSGGSITCFSAGKNIVHNIFKKYIINNFKKHDLWKIQISYPSGTLYYIWTKKSLFRSDLEKYIDFFEFEYDVFCVI